MVPRMQWLKSFNSRGARMKTYKLEAFIDAGSMEDAVEALNDCADELETRFGIRLGRFL